jgi:hypothetical protein
MRGGGQLTLLSKIDRHPAPEHRGVSPPKLANPLPHRVMNHHHAAPMIDLIRAIHDQKGLANYYYYYYFFCCCEKWISPTSSDDEAFPSFAS